MDDEAGLREQALALRRNGMSRRQIRDELKVWNNDKLNRLLTGERRQHMQQVCWAPRRELRDTQRRSTKASAAQEVGRLSERDLFIVGVGLYRAEGSKGKAYSRRERVNFVNSDPDMIRFFLRWLRLLGFDHPRLRFTLQIHASADVEGVEKYWQELVGAGSDAFCKTTLKAHNPKTNRLNTQDGYRGCLAVRVLGGAELYRRIEGWWSGMVVELKP